MLRRCWVAHRGLTSYITDVEGSSEFFTNFLSVSRVVRFRDGRLHFRNDDDKFVFGGDCFDRGTGDLAIARYLVDFKRRHPDRVFLLLGNRDVNKMKLTAELHHTELSRCPHEVPRPYYISSQYSFFSFADYVEKHKIPRHEHHDAVHRLKWLLSHTMGCAPTFELRRKELAMRRGRPCSPNEVTDVDVLSSYLDSLKPGGAVAEYLQHAQPVSVVDDTIFVHGAVNKYCVGFVPDRFDIREQPYFNEERIGVFDRLSADERAAIGRRTVPGNDIIRYEGASIEDWVIELIKFARHGVDEWLAQPTFESPHLPPMSPGGNIWGRRRGGTSLLSYPHVAVMGQKTCIISTFVEGGTLKNVDLGTVACLNAGGISRVVVGHQPCGDTPSFVMQPGLQVICADSSYSAEGSSDHANGRGMACSEVVIDSDAGVVTIGGMRADGTPYEFSVGDQDEIVGRRCSRGWWAKAYRNNGTEVLFQRTANSFHKTQYEWVPVDKARQRLQEGTVLGGCGGSINWGWRTEDLQLKKSVATPPPPPPKTKRTKRRRDTTHHN